jgi:Recombination endonuclease VII
MDCFKLTTEKWDTVDRHQGNRCAICGRPERRPNQRLATDHDWATGEFRGLLCSQCNPWVGKLERAFIRLGMHKEGLVFRDTVLKLAHYMSCYPAYKALGYVHIGYAGDVSTKAHRKRIKKLKGK